VKLRWGEGGRWWLPRTEWRGHYLAGDIPDRVEVFADGPDRCEYLEDAAAGGLGKPAVRKVVTSLVRKLLLDVLAERRDEVAKLESILR